MSVSALSAEAQISLNAKPGHNAKLTLAMLSQHTVLSGEIFNNVGQLFGNYYKELAVINEDKTLSPETVKSRLSDAALDLDTKLKAVLSPGQLNDWLKVIKPDVQKQLQNN